MSLNINLFIHGVPMGQKIWGPKGEDNIYMSAFYGPKWDVPEVMKVEVMTFGGSTYCYYSFVKGQKVYDYQGRAGSYFALTLRINAFYADIQNLYGILKAAYDKMCVGLCTSESEGSVKYLCHDFQNINTNLKEIENHILNYISEFSIADDILNFDKLDFEDNGSIKSINLHECTKNLAIEQIRQSGKLMVSPYYLSFGATRTIAQFKAETQTIIDKSKQEILLHEQACQEKINDVTRCFQNELKETKERSEQRLSEIKDESERKISDIRRSYEDVDIKMNALNHTIRDREREISEWKSKYQKKDKEMLSCSKVVHKLEQQLIRLQRDFDELRKNKRVMIMPEPKKVNWIIVGVVSFFTSLLVGFLIWFLLHSLSIRKQEIQNLRNEIEQLKAEKDDNVKDSVIMIRELSNGDNIIKLGQQYHLEFKNRNDESSDTLISNEFFIKGNLLWAKREFEDSVGRISYRIDGKEVAYRKLLIKK